AFNNQVNWVAGLLLGVGNIMGGLLGAQVSVKKGHAFIKKTISIAVIIFAVKLLLD
ncbi:MAG: integrase, partial [Candidatus Marinimicrobia bacterium CG_4_9_14_3_um_filter_48_9]